MSEQHEPFSPHRVDESIEQLISTSRSDNAACGPMRIDPSAHLVHDLQKLYGPERKRYLQALQRVEDRLVECHITQTEQHITSPIPLRQLPRRWEVQQGRLDTMENEQSSSSRLAKIIRNVSLVAAVLIVVGSMIAILNFARQSTTGRHTAATPTHTKTTLTPTSGNVGKVLYTTSPNNVGFNSLSWSPDSRRVVSATIRGVQIWDATTGQHLVSVSLPTLDDSPDQAIWSPNSDLVAVMTNRRILIVNGETGAIVKTISNTTGAISNMDPIAASPSGKSSLSSFFPNSSGLEYSILAWSPDSHFIAFFFGSSGLIQVWNSQTGMPVFNLPVDSSYNVGPLAWSPDGNYLTAQMHLIPAAGQDAQSNTKIVVWSVSTHQVVFQHEDIALNSIFAWSSDSQYLAVGIFTEEGPDNFSKIQKIAIVVWSIATRQIVFQHQNITGYDRSELISWQPGSHNLAFSGNAPLHDLLRLEIWNVTTGKLLKQVISDIGVQTWAWSPDGKFLAYSGYSDLRNTITILDTTAYQQVYAFNGHQNHVSMIVWSPNSKYIASGEGNTDRNMVAKVWIAQ